MVFLILRIPASGTHIAVARPLPVNTKPRFLTTVDTNIREFLWVAVPKSTGAFLQLVFNFLLLWQLGSNQFGALAVCLTGLILADAVLGSSFDMAVLRVAPLEQQDNPQYSLQVQQAGLLLKPALGVLAAVPLVLFGNALGALLFQQQGSATLLYLTAAAVLARLTMRSVQTHFQVGRNFRRYGSIEVLHSVGRYGGIAVLIALRLATPERVLAMCAAAPLVLTSVFLATQARALLQVPLSGHALAQVLRLVKTYIATSSVGSTVDRIDLFLVTSLASVSQAGIFAAAQTMVLVPQLLGMYLGVVFSPRVMPLWKRGELAGVYRRFQKVAFLACCAVFVIAVPAIRPVAAVLLPHSFASAAGVALILLPVGLVGFLNFPWTVSLLLFSRPRLLVAIELAFVPVLVAGYTFAIPRYGAGGAAAVSAAYALLKTATLQALAWRTLRRPPAEMGLAAPPGGPVLAPSRSF